MTTLAEDVTASVAERPRANKVFAVACDWLANHQGRTARKMRGRILAGATGDVLEIGCGTGASFPYYRPGARVIATDPDSAMLQRAERRLNGHAASIELRQSPAEVLPFADASFDHVVSCWVFCHVDDAARALSEVARVLRPGGAFRVMEHVRSDGALRGKAQDLIDPLWSHLLGAGCHINRRTQQAMEGAGFRFQWIERLALSPATTSAIHGVARLR